MSGLKTIDSKDAKGKARELLAGVQEKFGMTPTLMRTMVTSPSVLEAYLGLRTPEFDLLTMSGDRIRLADTGDVAASAKGSSLPADQVRLFSRIERGSFCHGIFPLVG